MTARTVVYDAGMLVALLRGQRQARLLHQVLRVAPHRPIVIGPVLTQAWRPGPATAHALSRYLKDCAVPQTRDGAYPVPGPARGRVGCVGRTRASTLDFYQRAGAMLATARLPAKKRPDAVDALVVVAAALHTPAQIITSDPDDIAAYAATLDHADILCGRSSRRRQRSSQDVNRGRVCVPYCCCAAVEGG